MQVTKGTTEAKDDTALMSPPFFVLTAVLNTLRRVIMLLSSGEILSEQIRRPVVSGQG